MLGCAELFHFLPYIITFAITILAVLIAYAAYCLNELHKQYDHIPGPERTSFWTGNLGYFIAEGKKGKHFGDVLIDLTKTYGYTIKLFFLHKPSIFTVDEKAVKELLAGGYSKSKDIYENASKVFGSRALGKGLVTETNNEKWNRKRNLMNPAFKREYLIGLMSQFNEGVDKMIEHLTGLADGKTVICMRQLFSNTTLDVLGKVAFNKDLDSLKHKDNQFPGAIRDIQAGMSFTSKQPSLQYSPTYWPFRRRVRQSVKLIRETGQKWIYERIAAINNNESVPNDILTHITKMMGENMDLDFEEIKDDFCTFFIAGQETISTALTFAVMFLGQNPDKMEKVVDEIDTVLGENDNIDYNDIGKLNYLEMVWKETLRLYPPSIATVRESDEDFFIGGYRIPPHTNINLSSYVSSRLPENNEKPLEFIPERFSQDSTIKPSIYTNFPFTLGPRICIGQQFAKIEGKLILAKLLQNFEVTLDKTQTYDVILESTLRLKNGLKCTLTKRSPRVQRD